MDSLPYPLSYLTFAIHSRLLRKTVMLPFTAFDRLIGVLESYDRDRLNTTINATMSMATTPIDVDINNMSGSSGVPVSSVVVEGVEEVGAFHPASMATSHQNARPFCSQLV